MHPCLNKTQRSDVKAGTASLDPIEVQQLELYELQQARLLSSIDRLLSEYLLLFTHDSSHSINDDIQ